MSIISRIKSVIASRRPREDPSVSMDRRLREYRSCLEEVKAIATREIAKARDLGTQVDAMSAQAADMEEKAVKASAKADSLAARGRKDQAASYDDAARAALTRQADLEDRIRLLEPKLLTHRQSAHDLAERLEAMTRDYDVMVAKRDDLAARASAATATLHVTEVMGRTADYDPTGDMASVESSVRALEARAIGSTEVASAGSSDPFAELASSPRDRGAERLAQIKAAGNVLPSAPTTAPQIGASR